MARLKTAAFFRGTSCWNTVHSRFSTCEHAQKLVLSEVDKEKASDIKAEQESLLTEQELTNRESRRKRYQPEEEQSTVEQPIRPYR
jgi:hypothetical protein